MVPALYQPSPDGEPAGEIIDKKYCLIQLAWSVRGLFIVTVIVVELEDNAPLHDVNRYREVLVVTFEGLSADTVTVELGEYQALGVAVPPFAFTVSKYCVE